MIKPRKVAMMAKPYLAITKMFRWGSLERLWNWSLIGASGLIGVIASFSCQIGCDSGVWIFFRPSGRLRFCYSCIFDSGWNKGKKFYNLGGGLKSPSHSSLNFLLFFRSRSGWFPRVLCLRTQFCCRIIQDIVYLMKQFRSKNLLLAQKTAR